MSLSLVEALADVPDPRSRQGRRYPLPAVLCLVTFGLLTGRTSLDALCRLGHDCGPGLILALGFPRRRLPGKAMLSRLLRRLNADAVENALARWVAGRLPEDVDLLSLDGKTPRAAATGAFPASTWWPPTPLRSKPSSVRSKSMPRPTSTKRPSNYWASCRSRAKWSPAMPSSVNATWRRRSSTGTATTSSSSRQTSRAWRETYKSASLSPPRPRRSPWLFPPEAVPQAADRVTTTVDKGHGRLEKRTLRTTTILTLHPLGPGLAQGFELTRERTEKGRRRWQWCMASPASKRTRRGPVGCRRLCVGIGASTSYLVP